MSECVDKQALIELLKNTENEEIRYILNYLLTSYKFDEWQTIDEFKGNPVEGWLHISYGEESNIDKAYFDGKTFHWNDIGNVDDNWNGVNITHVMPIKTPEAPK